jgi:hypothetical protein
MSSRTISLARDPPKRTTEKRCEVYCQLMDSDFPSLHQYTEAVGCVSKRVNALLGDLGPAKRSQITSPFILLYESRFSGGPRASGERARPKKGPFTGACSLFLQKEPGGKPDEK